MLHTLSTIYSIPSTWCAAQILLTCWHVYAKAASLSNTCAHILTNTRIHTHTHTHTNTRAYTRMHTHTHTHTHTHRYGALQTSFYFGAHTVTHCHTLQHTATHCNTLQHTATHTKGLLATTFTVSNHYTPDFVIALYFGTHPLVVNTLQRTATHCNTP